MNPFLYYCSHPPITLQINFTVVFGLLQPWVKWPSTHETEKVMHLQVQALE